MSNAAVLVPARPGELDLDIPEIAWSTEAILHSFEMIEDIYSYHIREFTAWARAEDRDVNEDSIRDYFAYLNRSDYSPSTIRVKRAAVKRRVRRWIRSASIDDRMRMDRLLKELDEDEKAPSFATTVIGRDKIVTDLEFSKLMDRARSPRLKAFMTFLMATGARVTEMVGIKLKDVEELPESVLLRIMGKGRKARVLRLSTALYGEIREIFDGATWLFETAAGGAYTRGYISDSIRDLGRRTLGRTIGAHTFRHSFATRMIARYPEKLDAISRYLGHSSVSITLEFYSHSEIEDGELFDADLFDAVSLR